MVNTDVLKCRYKNPVLRVKHWGKKTAPKADRSNKVGPLGDEGEIARGWTK